MQTSIGENISLARTFLEKGEVVAVPTETVYGLAANALDPEAVIRIFEAKQRPQFNPLIVHCKNWETAMHYTERVPEIAHRLAKAFTPGPITFLLYKKSTIPDLVTAGSDKVAIRIPKHPLTQALMEQLSFPLAAPSANQFGYISPTTARHVYDSLNGKISYILDGGESEIGLESTIIGFDDEENILLYRSGGIAIEALEEVAGKKILPSQKNDENKPQTAGQLASHYAPGIPLYLGDIETLHNRFSDKKMALISLDNPYSHLSFLHRYTLSASGNLHEAARNLFSTMRLADRSGVDVILAEKMPEVGLGIAINDRLNRAQVIFK